MNWSNVKEQYLVQAILIPLLLPHNSHNITAEYNMIHRCVSFTIIVKLCAVVVYVLVNQCIRWCCFGKVLVVCWMSAGLFTCVLVLVLLLIEDVSRSLFIPVISVDVELLRCVLVNPCSLFGVALVVAVRLLAYITSRCVYELILMLLFRQSSVDLCMNLCWCCQLSFHVALCMNLWWRYWCVPPFIQNFAVAESCWIIHELLICGWRYYELFAIVISSNDPWRRYRVTRKFHLVSDFLDSLL